MGDLPLPAVELVEDAFYWVAPAYGDDADTWVVARWSVGSFWFGKREVPPRLIVGPIPPPSQNPGESHER